MSDFEYDEPSSENDDNYEPDYEPGYSDDDSNSEKIEMDLDRPIDKPIETNSQKTKPIKIEFKKPSQPVQKAQIQSKQTKQIIQTKKESEEESKETKESKESKVESKFEFNMELCDSFIKDLDANQIFIRNSKYIDDDTSLTYLYMKTLKLTEYKCSTKKCKVNTEWINHPIQLLLNRIDGVQSNLMLNNLELLCPNCFMVKYGLELFKKKVKEATYNCKFCGYNLANMANYKKKERICLACQKRISKIGFETIQASYYKELENKTIDTQDTISTSKNTYSTSETASATTAARKYKATTTKKNNTKDIITIKLDTSLPDIDDL